MEEFEKIITIEETLKEKENLSGLVKELNGFYSDLITYKEKLAKTANHNRVGYYNLKIKNTTKDIKYINKEIQALISKI